MHGRASSALLMLWQRARRSIALGVSANQTKVPTSATLEKMRERKSSTSSRIKFTGLTTNATFGDDFSLTLLFWPNGKFEMKDDELDIHRSLDRSEKETIGLALYSKVVLLDR